MVVLQNCMDLEKDVPLSWSQTFPVSSCDENQFMNIKVEEVSDVEEEEEDPLLTTFSQIKADEHKVSCMSMCFISVCLSFKMTQLH
jgi:hypothetical protein